MGGVAGHVCLGAKRFTREGVNALLELRSGVVDGDFQIVFVFVPDDLQVHHLLLAVCVVAVANTRVLSCGVCVNLCVFSWRVSLERLGSFWLRLRLH